MPMMGASNKSPLTGYNHNMKYKGRIYHVQTEDSGLSSPHVFTHLFYDGTILATKKTDYHHIVPQDDWADQVRQIMQGSHKEMMKGLLRGHFDEKIIKYLGSLEGADQVIQSELERVKPSEQVRQTPQPVQPRPSTPAQPPNQKSGSEQRSSVVVASPVVMVSGKKSQSGVPKPLHPSNSTKPQSHEYTVRGGREDISSPDGYKTPAEIVPENIFGDAETVDEKSLDEVILAYLSEDLPDK